jgi:acyl-CoA reductase-like NAD-dependent aldehyde dehydrogenase
MKIEVEVDDALVQALGEEAIKDYLNRKASQLAQALQRDTGQTQEETDTASIQKAWTHFNKRGPSC